MNIKENSCRVAVVQATPVMFDKQGCLEKIIDFTKEAAANNAQLVVFPELMIPGYPYGMTFGFRVGCRGEEGRKDWKLYYDHSIAVDDEEFKILAATAKEAGVWLSVGFSERDRTTATLYNSNAIFSPQGKLETLHRKLKPTGTERVVWGDANKHYFPMAHTPWGPMASLICWESYMPLARVALYDKGLTLYISPNTNDNEEWQATIRHIAIEGHCFFINCNQYFTKNDYPVALLHCQQELDALNAVVCRGGSCVVDPYGHYLTEPLWDQEGIIYADLDMQAVPASRMEFDGCGHYSRPDVLTLQVNDQ